MRATSSRAASAARASSWGDGRPEEALGLLRSALALAVDGNHVEAAVAAYWALGATANDWADYATAQAAFDDALVYCRANHLSDDEQLCVGCLAVVLRHSGEWARAEQLARALLQRPSLHRLNTAHAHMTLGLIAAARGSTKRGRSLLTRALATAREWGCGHRHSGEFGLALVDELEDVASPRWHGLVTAHVESMTGSRAAGPAPRFDVRRAARRHQACVRLRRRERFLGLEVCGRRYPRGARPCARGGRLARGRGCVSCGAIRAGARTLGGDRGALRARADAGARRRCSACGRRAGARRGAARRCLPRL